jgi:hypothetical protein
MSTRTAQAFTDGVIVTGAMLMNVAGGWIGYVEKTSSTTGIGGTEVPDILTVTVTVGTSRRLKISCFFPSVSASSNGQVDIRIKESSTQLTFVRSDAATTADAGAYAQVVITPSSGSHTYSVAAIQAAGAGTTTLGGASTSPAHLLVEDIGPA